MSTNGSPQAGRVGAVAGGVFAFATSAICASAIFPLSVSSVLMVGGLTAFGARCGYSGATQLRQA